MNISIYKLLTNNTWNRWMTMMMIDNQGENEEDKLRILEIIKPAVFIFPFKRLYDCTKYVY
jgi:hypothetical protein